MRRTLFSIWLIALPLFAQERLQSSLPEELRVPSTNKLVLQAHGVGDQIYACKAVGDKFVWTLKAPDAKLLASDGRVIGHHFAGPTWEAKDGSTVVGKTAASVPSPDPQSIPWLRLNAIQHGKNGEMSRVVSIQRLNTKGGKPPANDCATSNTGAEIRVPYQADYYFYANAR